MPKTSIRSNRLWAIPIAALVATGACSTEKKEADTTTDSASICIPGGTPKTMPESAREYVQMCEPELGVPPEFDCAPGAKIPITTNGVETNEIQPTFGCDNYSLQDGECVPGSTVNRITGINRDGSERPEVVWVQFCRSEAGLDSGGEIQWTSAGAQMIGYNYDSGATCYFELKIPGQTEFVQHDQNLNITSNLPGYDTPEFDQAFLPAPMQCVQCHQNEPFVHNPWIDSARLPSNPNESVLPILAPDAPYYVVGGSNWDMRTIHIDGNACLECHRIGMETDMLYRYNGFDANQWMPAHDPGSLSDAYQELLDCWENGPENTPGCIWWYPPGGGCEGREADLDFPFAAEHFNFPRDSFYGFD